MQLQCPRSFLRHSTTAGSALTQRTIVVLSSERLHSSPADGDEAAGCSGCGGAGEGGRDGAELESTGPGSELSAGEAPSRECTAFSGGDFGAALAPVPAPVPGSGG